MNKDDIKLTKKERLEAYDKIFGDDEEYINSFFKGYKPTYYFKTNDEELNIEKLIKDIGNTYTSSISSKGFTLDDMYKAMEQLEKLPPAPIEIEMNSICFNILCDVFKANKIQSKESINTLYGIKISIVEYSNDYKFNQMKIKYNNGNNKIIDVFNINCDKENLYKVLYREE
jgi:hypothetical protein